MRRDCVFEPLSNRWLPKRCGTALGQHVKPTLKAIDSEPYRFYRDPLGEQEIHEHEWAGIPLESETPTSHFWDYDAEWTFHRFQLSFGQQSDIILLTA